MSELTFEFVAEVREWEGPSAWYFAFLPTTVAGEIADHVEGRPRAGFGSVRVDATIGATTWRTSIFPSRPDATYLLPVKKSVRAAEGIQDGSRPTVTLTLVDV